MFNFLGDLEAVIQFVLIFFSITFMFAVIFYGWIAVIRMAIEEIDSYYGFDGSAYKRRKS